MDENEFARLYINVNSIMELTLRRLTNAIEHQNEADRPAPADEPSFEGLDFAALDGLDELIEEYRELGQTGEAIQSDAVVGPPSGGAGAFDIDSYLQFAYASEPTIQARLSRHYRSIAIHDFDDVLRQLPADLPPLTGILSAEGMNRWVTLHEATAPSLSRLIVLIRQLDEARNGR